MPTSQQGNIALKTGIFQDISFIIILRSMEKPGVLIRAGPPIIIMVNMVYCSPNEIICEKNCTVACEKNLFPIFSVDI